MKKYVCPICGYVHEGENPPAECPICHAPGSKFKEMTEKTWAAEHIVGVAKDAPQDVIEGLRMNFNGECSEVGMYLAMARATPKSENFISRRLGKKRNMPASLRSFWAR